MPLVAEGMVECAEAVSLRGTLPEPRWRRLGLGVAGPKPAQEWERQLEPDWVQSVRRERARGGKERTGWG